MKYNVDTSWKNDQIVIRFTILDYTSNITYTWKNLLFTTSVDITKAIAFNVAQDHALTRKYKEVYVEGDAKFIVQALIQDNWLSVLDNAKEVVLKGQEKLQVLNMIHRLDS